MPSLEVLDVLKTQINALGDEPRLLSERGRAPLENIPSEAAFDSELEKPPTPDSAAGGIDEMEALLDTYDREEQRAEFDFDEFDLDGTGDQDDVATPGPPGELASDESLQAPAADTDIGDIAKDDAAEALEAGEAAGEIDTVTDFAAIELTLDEDLDEKEETVAESEDAGDTPEFSADDFGDKYSLDEGEIGTDLSIDESDLQDAQERDEEGDEAEEFAIDEADFQSIQRTLSELPRNLKIALEELLADERRNPADIQSLVNALIAGRRIKYLAARYKAITKRTIALPRGYVKRSGLMREQRRASLAYYLLREGWPVVRIILIVIGASWILGAVVFMWVYRPIMGERLYSRGLNAIAADDLPTADQFFFDAWDGWPLFHSEAEDRIGEAAIVVKGWRNKNRWLDYARAFRQRRHWTAAREFYEGYLRVKPESKDVRLEYADFLSKVLGEYQAAVTIIEDMPPRGPRRWDRELTLAAGDVFLTWAEDDPSKYEEARFRYAKVLENSRNDERAILSMMKYHLSIKDDEEIERLLPVFNQEIPQRTEAPALAAGVYSDIARYLMARGEINESRRFIDLALGADPKAPEPSFVDALYWRQAGDEQQELQAHKLTLVNLEGRDSLTRKDLEMRILTLGGIGRIQASMASKLSLDSQETADAFDSATTSYLKAIDLYEDAMSRNQIGASPEYGKLYLEMGDILYHGIRRASDLSFTLAPDRMLIEHSTHRFDELRQAEGYYNQAEQLFGSYSAYSLPPYFLYRRGYIRYLMNRDDALLDFYRVVRSESENYEARIALGTVLLSGGDYEAAGNQYARAIELLDNELQRDGEAFNPNDRQNHVEFLLRYVVAWNNLGVGRARTAAQGGKGENYALALSAFTIASEYLDEVKVGMDAVASRGAVALRDDEEQRIVSEVNGRTFLLDTTSFPYINRIRLLGLDEAEDGEELYLSYPDIPSELVARN